MMGLIGPDRYRGGAAGVTRGGAAGVTRGVAGGRNPNSQNIQKWEGGISSLLGCLKSKYSHMPGTYITMSV